MPGKAKIARVRGVRRYPSTTGLTVTGSCSHSFSTRFSTEDLEGEVRTPEREAQLTARMATRKEHYAEQPCPECLSTETVGVAVDGLSQLCVYFRIPVPAPLDGSLRQRAAGESVRAGFLHAIASSCERGMYWAARSTLFSLLSSTVSSTWSESREPSKEFLAFMQSIAASKHNPLSGVVQTRQVKLAAWILARHQLLKHPVLEETRTAREWFLLSKLPRYRGTLVPRDIEPQLVFSALLVADYEGWQSWEEMWEAFIVLIRPKSDLGVGILTDRLQTGTVSLADVFSDIAAAETLNRMSSESFAS